MAVFSIGDFWIENMLDEDVGFSLTMKFGRFFEKIATISYALKTSIFI